MRRGLCPAPHLRGGVLRFAKILRILVVKKGNFNAFGGVGDFLFLRAESIFSFFKSFCYNEYATNNKTHTDIISENFNCITKRAISVQLCVLHSWLRQDRPFGLQKYELQKLRHLYSRFN